MTLEQQTVSLPIAKKLNSLGVKGDSRFYWMLPNPAERENYSLDEMECQDGGYYLGELGEIGSAWCLDYIPAFTVAELGELLEGSKYAVIRQHGGVFFFKQVEGSSLTYSMLAGHNWGPLISEADARGELLAYLLENNLITLP
jgi:hypothetical protein